MANYDFNHLELRAVELTQQGRWNDALMIYLFMADGDPSLDGGYLAVRIADCYRAQSRPQEASYWYKRAIEENPVVNAGCADKIARLGNLTIDHLL